jgi:hypothetical protein
MDLRWQKTLPPPSEQGATHELPPQLDSKQLWHQVPHTQPLPVPMRSVQQDHRHITQGAAMSKKDEALKLALETLEGSTDKTLSIRAITALREALAEQPAQQEPLGFMNAGHVHEMQQGRMPYGYVYPRGGAGASVAVYLATQPPAQRKPLKPEKVVKLKDAFYAGFESYVTPAVSYSDVNEEWAKYKAAHNIKDNHE